MNQFSAVSPIPLNDLKRIYQDSSEPITEAVNAVLASGWWLNGDRAARFCADFARYVGVEHCVGVANGTDALEIAFRALLSVRKPKGRDIITVANAGGYSTIAARSVGLTPVYVDIEEASQLADIDSILRALSDETALVVVTHLYGGVVDVSTLREKMDQAGHQSVPILEDCAQAHGAELHGKRVGSLGDIATFSFYPTKNLGAFGDAGGIVTSDDELAQACNALRQYGWSDKYTIARPGGRNSRIDEIQAAILSVLLPHLGQANDRRVQILARYAEALPEGVRLVQSSHGSVGHLAILLADDRDELRRHLSERRIGTDIHYPILDCDQPGWADMPKREAAGGLPVSRRSIGRLLTIPCFPGMTEQEIERVSEGLSAWRR
ncbi:DegT/DnrJ/EryC1/StrS family aminotransferase [Aureimonas glaciei]|uniref:Erythromycin biosynthesis sensory transduction protein EryC1 n=1 Tax=Aureimonas glaciei TaxID=1776957 RepID=A0A917D9N3_9HYPH|nr:DegT/DnrJ/EryC1/StrS family aminotransferase [Aureimonas glaciei]GGD14269.1 erythromycin biosynthesis sensory transduction protein EryC1 [Aureimonas glaciei]